MARRRPPMFVGPPMICEAGGSGWYREHVQVQVEVAAGHALDLGDTEGVAVEVLDMGVHADAVALVRGAVDHDLHWHSLAVRRQGWAPWHCLARPVRRCLLY